MNLHFSPEFVRMMGWALLHFVWQGALVAMLLSMVTAFCQRSSTRYAVAVVALVVMLALPFLTFLYLQQPEEPAATTMVASIQSLPAKSATPGTIVHHERVPVTPEPAQPETMLWLVRIWMAGVVIFSLRSAGGYVLVQRLRRMATTPATGELLQICRAMQERMGIARAVRFCRSTVLQVPAVIGGIRPIVLLPISALTGLSDSQIEAIVAHELAHIRRLDYFVNIFQVFAEAALFYHPAVWWVSHRIRVERENCCDDVAIEVCGNRLDYVRALTHLESVRMTPQFAMGADGSPLKARVQRLLGMAQESDGVRYGNSVIGAVVVAGLVLAATSLATGAKPQQPTPPEASAVQPEQPAQPAVAAKPSAAVPARPEAPAAPQAEPTPAPSPEPMIAPAPSHVSVYMPPFHLAVPRVDVNVPPTHVNVPAVNVHVPAMSVHVPAPQAMNIALPAVDVHVPTMNLAIPAIHVRPMLGQAEASNTRPSSSYIDDMKAAGYGDLTVDQLIALKIQGVTPEYVRDMKAAGLKMDTDDLIGLKVQGVTPQYVKELRAAYPGIDTDTIIGMKVQGVTSQYAAELSKLGIKGDADELIGMKVQGVTPEYVRDMQATGLKFDTDELIGMKVQGVSPAFVAALKNAGYTKLDADDVIGAKVMGVTPEFIEKARSHGFKDLTLDKLIQLKNAGVL